MATYSCAFPVTSTLYQLALFGTGAVVMRGAGCTINDLWDRDIDNKVERTRLRPLAAKTVTPFQAVTFLGLQLSVGLAVLTQLNLYRCVLSAACLLCAQADLFPRQYRSGSILTCDSSDLSAYEANHVLAASLSGFRLQLGCPARVICGSRADQLGGRSPSICRQYLLDAGI
jgi:hypothetical protein